MIVRSLDLVGDWTYGRGKSNYLSRTKAVRQNIQTRLYSVLGDCFFDIRAGIDWFNLLGGKDQLALNLAISSTILNTRDVTKLVQLYIELNPRSRAMTVSYEVETVYTGLTDTPDIVVGENNFLLTEDGFIITDENGNPIITE